MYTYVLCTSLQVYTRLNHMNITLSYTAVLKVVTELSKRHLIPLQKWLNEKATIQFLGDNVDKRKSVRDVRSDNHAILHHMFSMIAIKARVSPPPVVETFSPVPLNTVPISTFLPSIDNTTMLRRNLVILISCVLCKYIKSFACHSKAYTTPVQ